MTDLFAVLAALGAGVCGAVASERNIKQNALRAIGAREALSDDEFSARFFQIDQRLIAVEVRRLLKPYIPIRHQLIRPHDELVRDLQVGAIDGLDAADYLRDLENAFGMKISDVYATRWLSFQDVVDGVQTHLQASAPDGRSWSNGR